MHLKKYGISFDIYFHKEVCAVICIKLFFVKIYQQKEIQHLNLF